MHLLVLLLAIIFQSRSEKYLLFTSEQANQRTQKAIFTCVVNILSSNFKFTQLPCFTEVC